VGGGTGAAGAGVRCGERHGRGAVARVARVARPRPAGGAAPRRAAAAGALRLALRPGAREATTRLRCAVCPTATLRERLLRTRSDASPRRTQAAALLLPRELLLFSAADDFRAPVASLALPLSADADAGADAAACVAWAQRGADDGDSPDAAAAHEPPLLALAAGDSLRVLDATARFGCVCARVRCLLPHLTPRPACAGR
jgi:hypothetical protein